MKNIDIAELFRRIKSNGLFTRSDTHDKVYDKLIENPEGVDGAKFIATTGEPKGEKNVVNVDKFCRRTSSLIFKRA